MNENRKNWSEFEWERELQRDERRINSYFGELPTYIDLPGEEDVIIKKLMSRPELVPAGKEWPGPFFGGSDEDPDGFFDFGDWRYEKDAGLINSLQTMAFDWNRCFAADVSDRYFATGMSITCLFGKLMSRTVELLSAGEELPQLSRCLCKHLCSDINDLIGLLRKMKRGNPGATYCDNFISGLLEVREKIIDRLHKPISEDNSSDSDDDFNDDF
jgi:hypothetical protein